MNKVITFGVLFASLLCIAGVAVFSFRQNLYEHTVSNIISQEESVPVEEKREAVFESSRLTNETFEEDEFYHRDDKGVYRLSPHDGSRNYLDVDRETFVILKSAENSAWAKDKNHVYNHGGVVQGVEPTTFSVYFEDPNYAKAGDILLYSVGRVTIDYRELKDVDFTSFQILGYGYARDAKNVYYGANVLENVDSKTFELLPNQGCSRGTTCSRNVRYGKDASGIHVLREYVTWFDWSDMAPPPLSELVAGADVDSFTVIGMGYSETPDAQDKRNRYHEGKVVK